MGNKSGFAQFVEHFGLKPGQEQAERAEKVEDVPARTGGSSGWAQFKKAYGLSAPSSMAGTPPAGSITTPEEQEKMRQDAVAQVGAFAGELVSNASKVSAENKPMLDYQEYLKQTGQEVDTSKLVKGSAEYNAFLDGFYRWQGDKYLADASASTDNKMSYWANRMNFSDFESKGKYAPKVQSFYDEDSYYKNYLSMPEAERKPIWDTEISFADALYESVNGNYLMFIKLNNDERLFKDPLRQKLKWDRNSATSSTLHLGAEERQIFNYIFETEGVEKAIEFLNDMYDTLDARYDQYFIKKQQEWAKEDPFGNSLATVVSSPFRAGIGIFGTVTDLMDDGQLEKDAWYSQMNRDVAVIRGAIGDQIRDSWAGDVGGFLYDAGMSAGDSVMNTVTMGGFGLTGKAAQWGSSILSGSNAAVTAMDDALNRGLSSGQAMTIGILSGIGETLMEKVSLGTILDKKALSGNALKNIIKSAGVEGLEEVSTELWNTVADVIIAQDKSKWQMAIDSYKEKGLSEGAAFWRAVGDKAVELGYNFLAGATAGGMMSGGNLVMNAGQVRQSAQTRKLLGKYLNEGVLDGTLTSEQIQGMVNEGLALGKGTGSYALAEKIQTDMSKGKMPKGETLAQLVAQSYTDADGKEGAKPVSIPQLDTKQQPGNDPPADPLSAAMEGFKTTGTVTNSQARDILNNTRAVQQLIQQTGIQLPDTASGRRAAVKQAVAHLAQQKPPSPIDTAQNTDYDNQNTTGGNLYAAGQTQQEVHIPHRGGEAGLFKTPGSAPTQTGNRPGISGKVGANPGTSTQIRSDWGQRDGLTDSREPYAPEDYIQPEEGSSLQQIQHEFSEQGIDCKVVRADKWGRKNPAFTRAGKVYISDGIDADTLKTAIPHEKSHVMRQTEFAPYLDFVSHTSDLLNVDSESYQMLLDMVSKHTGIDIFSMDDGQFIRFYDELNAIVYGMQKAGVLTDSAYPYGDFIPGAFTDFDGYIKELDSIHEQFRQESIIGAPPTTSNPTAVGNAMPHAPGGSKVSKLHSNTYANATGEAVRGIGEWAQELDPNIARYDPVTEEESFSQAVSRASSPEARVAEIENLLNKNGWTGADNDTAYLILDKLRQEGDTVNFAALAAKQRSQNTTGAQLVQSNAKYTRENLTKRTIDAFNTLSDMTERDVPKKFWKDQGFEAWKEETGKAILDISNQLEQAAENGSVEDVRKIIRSLAQFRRTTAWFGFSSNLTKVAEKGLSHIDTDTAKAMAMAQLSQIPEDFRKRPVGQVIETIRVHNMLAALTTVNRNLFGNGVVGLVDATSDSTVGRCMDMLLSKITGKRTVGNDLTHGKAYLNAAAKSAAMASLCVELDIPMDSDSRFTEGSTRTFSPRGGPVTRLLGAYEKFMRYNLEVTDQFFSGGTAGAVDLSLQNLSEKANLTDEERQDLARQAGLRRTFKEDRVLSEVATGTKHTLNKIGKGHIGLGNMVMPFARTGSNVTQTGADYTGAGLVIGIKETIQLRNDIKNGLYKNGVKTDPKTGKQTTLAQAQRRAATNMGRGLTGLGTVALFTSAALCGILKVHDDDDKDAKSLDQSGNLSGAQLNLSALLRGFTGGNTSWLEDDCVISMDFLEPFNSQMYLGYALSQEKDLAAMLTAYPEAAVKSLWQSMLDMPAMQGLSDVVNLADNDDPTDAFGQLVGNQASSFIPSWMRQTAQWVDPYYRDTSGGDVWEKAGNQVLSRVPFLSQTLPKKLDGLGRDQLRHDGDFLSFLNTFVNPGQVEHIRAGELESFIDSVAQASGSMEVYPSSTLPTHLQGQDRETYKRAYGETVTRVYSDLMDMESFHALDAETQATVMKSALDYASSVAKSAVIGSHEEAKYITNRPEGMSEADVILHKTVESSFDSAFTALTKSWSSGWSDDAALTELEGAYTTFSALPDNTRTAIKNALTGRCTAYVAARESGMSTDTFSELYRQYRQISDTDLSPSDKAQKWAHVLEQSVERHQISTSQRDLMKEELGFVAIYSQDSEGYDKMLAAGVSSDSADLISDILRDILPEDGYPSVRPIQKLEAIAESDELTDEELERILPLYMSSDSTRQRYDMALDKGFSSEEFVVAYRIYLDKDGETKTQLIRQMANELDIPYTLARQLYEIHSQRLSNE